MIDLYTWSTANGLRPSIALAESGLEYRVHKVHFVTETKTPDFLALNPAGQIPVLVDSDGPGGKPLTIAQSGAILLYVAEKSGRFLPTDPARRATVFQWFMAAATDLSAANGAIFMLENETPEKSARILQFFKDRLLRFYSLIDQQLSGRDFIAGELSIADLILYPNYFKRKPLLDAAGGLTHLHQWGAKMGARPGVKKGLDI